MDCDTTSTCQGKQEEIQRKQKEKTQQGDKTGLNSNGTRQEREKKQTMINELDNDPHTATCTQVENDDNDNMDTQRPGQCPHTV